MGLWDSFVKEFKSGYLGIYAGWLAVPTILIILAAAILTLVFHWDLISAIIGFAVFLFMIVIEFPLFSGFVQKESVMGRFLDFIRHPGAKAFIYTLFSFVLWMTIPSVISVQSFAAAFSSFTALLYLSAALKRENYVERYVQSLLTDFSKLKGGSGIPA